LRLGTEWYQIGLSDTNAQYNSPYGSSIKRRRKFSLGEATPEKLSDRKTVASITGIVTSMNLGVSIDRGVKESQQDDY
jgi:hypothetical protein